jgi:surface antigen
MRAALFLAAAAALAAGCVSRPEGVATMPGANPGMVLDSPVAAGAGEPPLGVVEGGLLGTDIGRSLGEAERQVALRAEYEALEYGRAGQATEWSRGETRGEIVVGALYQVNRLECREYTHRIWIGGRQRAVRGTACRQPDAVWRVLG